MNNQLILIENVPNDWVIKKIKYVFDERKETNDPIQTDVLVSLTHDRGVILHSEKGDIGNKEKDDIKKYKIVHPGDIVVNSMNVIIGSSGLSDYFGLVSPVYYMLVKKDPNHDNKFFHYLFRSIVFQKSLIGVGNGILEHRMRVPIDKLGGHLIPLPSANEQKLISRYLDKTTSQIDSLVKKIQKKIELLKEQRTSLINHYVTKGLDPNVEMKDSGIEWIGEIPKHWILSKFGFVASLETGNTPSKSEEDLYFTEDQNGFLWVKPSDLDVGFQGVSDSEVKLTFEGREQSRVIPKDSILVCCIGNTSGKFSIANCDLSTNQQINSITFKDQILPRYGLYYMGVFGRDLLKWMNFVTLPIISKGDLSQQPVIVPPKSEQKEISEILDKIISEHKVVTELHLQKIQLLKEYRQSLISSVVTGKVRVTEDMI